MKNSVPLVIGAAAGMAEPILEPVVDLSGGRPNRLSQKGRRKRARWGDNGKCKRK